MAGKHKHSWVYSGHDGYSIYQKCECNIERAVNETVTLFLKKGKLDRRVPTSIKDKTLFMNAMKYNLKVNRKPAY